MRFITALSARLTCPKPNARPIRHNGQVPDRNGKIFYTSITSLSHISKGAGDICPSQQAPVLTGEGGELHLELMTWGFLPPAGEEKREGKGRPGGLLINARAETALEKRMFRDSIRSRRCVIPAAHFYEWDEDGDRAQFSDRESPLLYMAGFYRYFQEEKRFIILTTRANASVERVHDRMPVLLGKEEIASWVFEDEFMPFVLERTPAELEKFQEYQQTTLADLGLEL